jgi:hypothetical protein
VHVTIPDNVDPDEPIIPNAGRLWTGGVATAVVAALVVVAGVFIARGILNIPVLAPKGAGNLGNSSTAVYAGLAAASTLLATALLHVLLLEVPRPITFFFWIVGLGTIIVAAAPFIQPAPPVRQGLYRSDQPGDRNRGHLTAVRGRAQRDTKWAPGGAQHPHRRDQVAQAGLR